MHDNESTAVGLQYYIRVPQQTGGTRHSYLLLPIIVSHNMDTQLLIPSLFLSAQERVIEHYNMLSSQSTLKMKEQSVPLLPHDHKRNE